MSKFVDSPARSSVAINIAATDHTLSPPSRGLYVGGAGDVVVRLDGDDADVTFAAVPAGSILPIIVGKVVKTGTSASNIVALW